MPHPQNNLLVTGSHRSGTSYTGAVMQASKAYYQLLEPTNPVYGSTMADCWFPYARSEGNGGAKGPLVDSIFNRTYRYRHYIHGSLPKQALKAVLGSKASREAAFYKYIGHYFRPLLIKDPLASFLAERMARRHKTDVLICLRHPMSFFGSAKVGGHNFDFNNFLSQPDLLADFLAEEEPHLRNTALNYAERYGLLWRCINKVLFTFYDRHQSDERWHIHKHEDMCTTPVETFGAAYTAFGLTLPEELKPRLTQRARAEFVYAWQSVVDQQEMDDVARFARPLADRFYAEKSWTLEKAGQARPEDAF